MKASCGVGLPWKSALPLAQALDVTVQACWCSSALLNLLMPRRQAYKPTNFYPVAWLGNDIVGTGDSANATAAANSQGSVAPDKPGCEGQGASGAAINVRHAIIVGITL